MAEPPVTASELHEVVPGLYHWRVENPNIGGDLSSSHALRDDGAWVLVDPIPLDDESLGRIEPVSAIVLTAATHQRSSWRYRRRFEAPVWLPGGSRETEEEPDVSYGAGDLLPGGLRAIQTPGPELPHYSLLREAEPRALFSPDLVMEHGGRLVFVPGRFHEDPQETRRSVERCLELEFDILCLAHGAPVTDDPKAALRDLLAGGG